MTTTHKQIADWLDEAADDIESWGAYATEYFQTKHDLTGNAKTFRDRAAQIRAASDRPSHAQGEKG